DNQYEFSIREAAESAIRESAVSQAKDIILRRVDSMGLREASVSIRAEDIIVEVPGEDEASFNEIRDIISKTARLEFKLLDDENQFFRDLSETISSEDPTVPKGLTFRQESVPLGMDGEGDEISGVTTYAYLPA